MKFYRAVNLCLASELKFPELIPLEGKRNDSEADITVRLGKVDSSEATDSNIVGSIPGVARFSFRNGCEMTVSPLPGTDEALLRSTILGPALCLLLEQRGLLVLHASCINIDNQAVAFMGGSGWGKSTLATAFHRQGYNVLTDDVMPLDITAEQTLVLPSYPQFKVSPEALASLGEDTSNLSPVYETCTKLSYRFTQGFQTTPLPLRRIYVLRKGEQHDISPVKTQDAFSELVRHTRAIGLLQAHKGLIVRHLHLCTELVKQVSFCYFTRKQALEDLPTLIELVKADIASPSHALAAST